MIEWFRHDTDARNDIKIRKLLRDNDRAALGAYWMCIEIIYQNEGYADEAAVTEELSFYDMDEFIPAMIALDLIERAEGGKLTSKRVLSEIETNKKMAEVRSEKARKAINTRWHKNGVESNGIQTNTDEYGCIRTDTKHTTQHNTTQQDKYRSVSKDTSLGEHCECPPVEEAGKTDLFGQKVEEERERVPVQKVVDYWNKAVKDTPLPQIRQPNESRKTLIRQRWAEYKNDVYEAIDRTVSSDFLTGRDGKWSRCCFDWVFKKENMVKILEGNYDNKKEEAVRRHKDYSDIKDEDLEEEFHWT